METLSQHQCCAGPDLNSERLFRGITAFIFFRYVCNLACHAADNLLTEFSATYRKMSVMEKTDCVGRVYSTIHGIVAPLGHVALLLHYGGMGDFMADNCPAQEIFFGLSVGYFFFDAHGLMVSKCENWVVFLVHHALACYPLISMFLPGYGIGCFPFGFGMVIELSNVTMNALWWLEKFEMKDSRLYTITCYANFVNWLVFRITILYWLAWAGLIQYYRYFGFSCPCVYPSYVITTALLLFCTYVFVTMVMPDFFAQIRDTKPRRERRKRKLHTNAKAAVNGVN